MNNTDICRFINSKDIRKYLSDINYDFSALEAAWLVYRCESISLDEKISAWEDILQTMPDQTVDSFHFDKPIESLHRVLSEYLAMQRELMHLFTEGGKDVFYQYYISEYTGNCNYDYAVPYSSFENCYNEMVADMKDLDDILHAFLKRQVIDNGKDSMEATYLPDGRLSEISIPASWDRTDWKIQQFFDLIWLCFPAPYEEGDILYDPYHPKRGELSGPIVMTGITPLYYAKDGHKHSDSSDMIVSGYFQDEDTGTIYHEVTWNYMDFEYYPGELLTGKKRIVKALSNFVKKKIDLELFIKAYHLIMLEETKNDLMPRGWFTDEGMELAGLK